MKQLAARVLWPGITVMQRMRLPWKLAMLTMCLLLPLVILLVRAVGEVREDRLYVSGEREGARVARAIGVLANALYEQASSSPGAEPSSEKTASISLQQAVAEVDELSRSTTYFQFADIWAPLRTRLLNQMPQGEKPTADVGRAAVPPVLRELPVALHLLGERSGLLFDPEPATYFIVELNLERVLPVDDVLTRIRTLAPGLAAEDGSPVSRKELQALADELAARFSELREGSAALARAAGHNAPSDERLAAGVGRLLASMNAESHGPQQAQEIADVARQARVDLHQGEAARWLDFDKMLDARLTTKARGLAVDVAPMLIGFVALIYLVSCVVVSFGTGLKQLRAVLQAYAEGDLSVHATLGGRDELMHIAQSAERVAERLSNMVGEIRSSAMRLGQTGESVAATAATLAERSQVQADRLVATTSAISVGADRTLTTRAD